MWSLPCSSLIASASPNVPGSCRLPDTEPRFSKLIDYSSCLRQWCKGNFSKVFLVLDKAVNNPSILLSAVVPCYNEEDVLDELLRRLTAACEEIAGQSFEIVLVDDGSTDTTREMLRGFHDRDDRITAVLLSRNYGHQLALTAGLSVARGNRVFVLDADLQDPPELIGPMMARMDEGYDVVYGTRRSRKGESHFKIHSARLFYRLLSRLVEIDIPLDTGDFRLMSRRVTDALQAMPERQRFVRGLISWVGYRQSNFEYDRDMRFAGAVSYTHLTLPTS